MGIVIMYCFKKANKALQLTSNTPLRSVLRSTELKRYVFWNDWFLPKADIGSNSMVILLAISGSY